MEVTSTALAIASALLCVAWSIVTWHGWRSLYEHASKMDGPPVLPIIGNTILLTGDNKGELKPFFYSENWVHEIRSSRRASHYTVHWISGILKSITKFTKSYPSPFRFWIVHRLFHGVADPEHMKVRYFNKNRNKIMSHQRLPFNIYRQY